MSDLLVGPQAMEVSEFLMSNTQAMKVAGESGRVNRLEEGPLLIDMRQILRLHRFTVMSWLMQNGVSIPAELLSDQTHREVGQQLPDATSVNR